MSVCTVDMTAIYVPHALLHPMQSNFSPTVPRWPPSVAKINFCSPRRDFIFAQRDRLSVFSLLACFSLFRGARQVH